MIKGRAQQATDAPAVASLGAQHPWHRAHHGAAWSSLALGARRVLIWAVAQALGLLSFASLVLLLLWPIVPPPGHEARYELCLDFNYKMLRFDRNLVSRARRRRPFPQPSETTPEHATNTRAHAPVSRVRTWPVPLASSASRAAPPCCADFGAGVPLVVAPGERRSMLFVFGVIRLSATASNTRRRRHMRAPRRRDRSRRPPQSPAARFSCCARAEHR
eukprot:3331227-Prymnesium_polylepis.1